jgi:hypothetical protein
MKDIQKIKEFFSKPIKEGNEEYYKPKIRKENENEIKMSGNRIKMMQK